MTLLHWVAETWRNANIYNIVSGDIPDITLLSLPWMYLIKHNCHIKRCPRLSWHAHPDHGHQVCKRHHPHGAGIDPD